MAKSENIPSLARLALQYGTITQPHYNHLTALYALKQKEGKKTDFGALLLGQNLVTQYQLGLLQLIQEYHIVRRRGEEFGKIAVEKGFATPLDIQKALDIQKGEFKKARLKKLIGDILVETRVITAKQKQHILKEQIRFEKKADRIISDQLASESGGPDPGLSDYEKDFLRIKALDKDFSASVLEKGLASEKEISKAQKVQEKAFETDRDIKILGDIMVSLEFISQEQNDIILSEQGRAEEKPVTDPIRIYVSKDSMTAFIHIDKDALPRTRVAEVKARIKSHGITTGIYPDALLQGHLEMGFLTFAVARNDYSLALKKACSVEVDLDTGVSDRGEKRKGDLLAQQKSHWKLEPQKNLYGKLTKDFSDRDFTIRCGSGTRKSKDGSGILAAKTGVPSLSVERQLFIHPVIHVLEDADQRYGPLEAYANINVSGTITGAYPITAGKVKAREIRGAVIDALGDIHSDVGITDAVIRTQGDIHARYLHNCTIETFGDIYVKNEIFDSDIKCSGKIDSPNCRVIASQIYGKKGVVLAGTGSAKTAPCKVTAGGEHHVLALEQRIQNQIQTIIQKLDELKETKEEQDRLSKKIFQKMIELKVFHDRAEQKKKTLGNQFKKKKETYGKEKLKNVINLISNFDKRMEKSIATLKEFNLTKKKHHRAAEKLKIRIDALTPKVHRDILSLEQTLFSFFEWARFQENSPRIEIKGKAFQGSRFCGVFSEVEIDTDKNNFTACEMNLPGKDPEIEILEIGS